MKENFMKVCCDAPGCGWQADEHVEQMQEWHNAACPACGHAPVLNDEDMAVISGMVALRNMGLMSIGKESKLDKPSVLVTIDTAALRK